MPPHNEAREDCVNTRSYVKDMPVLGKTRTQPRNRLPNVAFCLHVFFFFFLASAIQTAIFFASVIKRICFVVFCCFYSLVCIFSSLYICMYMYVFFFFFFSFFAFKKNLPGFRVGHTSVHPALLCKGASARWPWTVSGRSKLKCMNSLGGALVVGNPPQKTSHLPLCCVPDEGSRFAKAPRGIEENDPKT